MKNIGNRALTWVGIVGMVLFIGAVFVWGFVATVCLVTLGAVLCAVVGALAKRQYESIPSSYVNPFETDRQRLYAEMEDPQGPPSRDRNRSRRSKVYVVTDWNRPSGQPVDHSRAATFVMPVVPAEHEPVVREYMHAGLALGQAMNDMLRHDQDQKLRINPGSVRRFAATEKAYAELGYRTLSVVEFRALANDSQRAQEQAGVRRHEGEQSQLYAGGIQAAHVDAYRKRSA